MSLIDIATAIVLWAYVFAEAYILYCTLRRKLALARA
jgi:hypothetical protein